MLDLRIAHERYGSSSDPSINGHLNYPNDLCGTLSPLCLLLLVRLGVYIQEGHTREGGSGVSRGSILAGKDRVRQGTTLRTVVVVIFVGKDRGRQEATLRNVVSTCHGITMLKYKQDQATLTQEPRRNPPTQSCRTSNLLFQNSPSVSTRRPKTLEQFGRSPHIETRQ